MAAAVLELLAGALPLVVALEDLELLEPHPVATIIVAASATDASHPFMVGLASAFHP